MPYINKNRRHFYESDIESLIGDLLIHSDQNGLPAGDINYVISRICWSLCNTKDGDRGSGVSYPQANTVVGVLECVKLELYRRMIAPYEDIKIEKNGDISSKEEE